MNQNPSFVLSLLFDCLLIPPAHPFATQLITMTNCSNSLSHKSGCMCVCVERESKSLHVVCLCKCLSSCAYLSWPEDRRMYAECSTATLHHLHSYTMTHYSVSTNKALQSRFSVVHLTSFLIPFASSVTKAQWGFRSGD